MNPLVDPGLPGQPGEQVSAVTRQQGLSLQGTEQRTSTGLPGSVLGSPTAMEGTVNPSGCRRRPHCDQLGDGGSERTGKTMPEDQPLHVPFIHVATTAPGSTIGTPGVQSATPGLEAHSRAVSGLSVKRVLRNGGQSDYRHGEVALSEASGRNQDEVDPRKGAAAAFVKNRRPTGPFFSDRPGGFVSRVGAFFYENRQLAPSN